ncbi:hypothetical protein CEXT_493651 [Caerostris extrusa]|uniref:Uncharacterized protein n=1 Tax=Caerostris extrusa TaxID=172846 RepID=A0AAV4PDK0_CAEEX|nr:hypothetical protein CEXT_493651 [Caerostris extrusa]
MSGSYLISYPSNFLTVEEEHWRHRGLTPTSNIKTEEKLNNLMFTQSTCVQQHSSPSEPVSKTAPQTGWPFECPTEPNAPIVGGPHRIPARDTKQTTITQPSKAEATSPKIPHSPKRGPLKAKHFATPHFEQRQEK